MTGKMFDVPRRLLAGLAALVTLAAVIMLTGTWPAEIRFRGIPAEGVRFTVRVPHVDRIRIVAIGETDGLSAVPGFVPRPPGLVAATREDGDLVAVTRGHTLTNDDVTR